MTSQPTLTRTSLLKIINISLSVCVILTILGYAIWRSTNYARGPQINISEPNDGTVIIEQTLEVSGQVERVSRLNLNGRPIPLDESGLFRQKIAIFDGLNIVRLDAQDKFGRSTHKELEILGKIPDRTTITDTISKSPATKESNI